MKLGDVTIVIHRCNSLEELQKVEDFVLTFVDLYNTVDITCIYTFLAVKNKLLYDKRIEKKLLYKN